VALDVAGAILLLAAPDFVKPHSAVCAAALGLLPWLDRREKTAQADRETCRALLAELKIARATPT